MLSFKLIPAGSTARIKVIDAFFQVLLFVPCNGWQSQFVMSLNGSINRRTGATVNQSLVDSKGLLVAYLAHLLVPVLLVLDIVLSWAIPTSTNGIQPPVEWWHSFGPAA